MGAEKGLIGIASVSMGTCGTNGTMGTTLTAVGELVPDSVSMVFEEPGKTDLFVEDYDTPWYTIPDNAVARQLKFSSRDVDPATLVKAFGGTVVNSTSWEAPTTITAIEQSVQAVSRVASGYKKQISIPRGLIRASLDGKMQKKDSGAINFIVDVLTPMNAGGTALSPMKIEKVTA